MGIEKVFFRCAPPRDQENLLRTVVVLHYRHHIRIACLVPGGGGGGGLSKCSKILYTASPSNQVTSTILFTTVAFLYTYFYLAEHDLVF